MALAGPIAAFAGAARAAAKILSEASPLSRRRLSVIFLDLTTIIAFDADREWEAACASHATPRFGSGPDRQAAFHTEKEQAWA
jgi:hypothetical protein